MNLQLNVFLHPIVSHVVCPECRDLIEPDAADGLAAHCACGYRVAITDAALDNALGPYYRDDCVPLEVETGDEPPATHKEQA